MYVANLNFVRKKKLSKVSGTSRWVFHRDEIGLSPSFETRKLRWTNRLIINGSFFSSKKEAGATILSTWKTSARLSTLKVNLTTCSGTLNVIFEEPQTILAFGNHCKENKSDFMIEMVFIFFSRVANAKFKLTCIATSFLFWKINVSDFFPFFFAYTFKYSFIHIINLPYLNRKHFKKCLDLWTWESQIVIGISHHHPALHWSGHYHKCPFD